MTFWIHKRVAVTGGNGFLGRHLVHQLGELGCLPSNVYVPCYDLRQTESAERLYLEFRPDIVIHLAASVGGINANIKSPGSFFYDNVKMGTELMEAGRRYGVKKFVQMGSACEYPKYTLIPTDENELWNGYPEDTNAPYGIAKKALLVMGQAYRKQYGMDVIHLLSTNLYGPGDNFDPDTSHSIPALIRRFEEAKSSGKESVTVWGDGSVTRDFLYVKDAVQGILLAAEHYDEPSPVNLGSGEEFSIRSLAIVIKGIVGFCGKILFDTSKPSGQPRRFLATNLAKEKFGFEATTKLEVGIKNTVEWYEEQCAK
jgi:GDP-L-fucose synthase